jgi:hypothetical protein
VPTKDILQLSKFSVGDMVFATTNGEIILGRVKTVLSWRTITLEENEPRYVLEDEFKKTINDNSDTTQPYKFQEANLQAFLPAGSCVHIRLEEDDILGVVKNPLVESDPLSCLVTVLSDRSSSNSSLSASSNSAYTVDRVLPRATWMRQVFFIIYLFSTLVVEICFWTLPHILF